MSNLDSRALVSPDPTITTKRAFEIDSKDRTGRNRWLDDPIVMSTLKNAVERKRKSVKLDGRAYEIEYGHNFPSKLIQDHDGRAIKLTRVDPRCFAAYVSMRRIEHFDFERGS